MVFCLFLTYPLTGHTSVQTFPTAFERGLFMIALANEPVVMRPVDYSPDDKLRMAKVGSVRPVHV